MPFSRQRQLCIPLLWLAYLLEHKRTAAFAPGVDGDAVAELEQSLVSQKIDMPIYFAVDNEELQNMVRGGRVSQVSCSVVLP